MKRHSIRILSLLIIATFMSEIAAHALSLWISGAPSSLVSTMIDASVLTAVLYLLLLKFVYRPMEAEISSRKEIEEQLRRSHEELEARIKERMDEIHRAYGFVDSVLENIPDMIFVKEARELRFVRFNKAGEKLLGYSKETLFGRNDYDFFPKSEADHFTTQDRNILSGRTAVDIPEEPIHTHDGTTRTLHTKKIPLFDKNGNPEYLLGISEDITEKKQAEENRKKLERAQIARAEAERGIELRDNFLSIAAHELKTPLTSLVTQIQLLNRLILQDAFSALPKDKARKMVDISQHQLERFSRLIDTLLDVARITAGRMAINTEEVNLSELVLGEIMRHRDELKKRGCPVCQQIAPSIIGKLDRIRIEEVIGNLLSNAMKYGAGNPIAICATTEGEMARILVTDHGPGIAKHDQQRIFDRFERAVSEKSYGGLGLGLYISRQIIEAHGGIIHVESELGQGATFIVEIPLKPKETAKKAS